MSVLLIRTHYTILSIKRYDPSVSFVCAPKDYTAASPHSITLSVGMAVEKLFCLSFRTDHTSEEYSDDQVIYQGSHTTCFDCKPRTTCPTDPQRRPLS